MKQDIKSFNQTELAEALKAMGEPAFRTKQVFTWLHKGCRSFDEMTNLSKGLRQKLDDAFYITVPHVVRKQESQKDGTIKYLWRLRDGNCVESVLMRYHHGNSICISEHPLLEEVRQELGIRRVIPMREVPGLPTPMLVGLFHPVVCLPDPSLSRDHLRMVLLHELTHYKRKDLLLKWLALLVNALHWFNPLAWLLTRSLGQACEDACDQDVTRNMTPQERKLYMSTILALAQA